MTFLVTADLHLTDNPRDQHRWLLFDWLAKQVRKHEVKSVLILGDVTDSKDRHSAVLVNKLVRAVRGLSEEANVIILKGNHDFINEEDPFFGFLDGTGFADRVQFLVGPTSYDLEYGTQGKRTTKSCLFLPSTKDYKHDWASFSFEDYDFIFAHATFDGAIAETGVALAGIPPSIFDGIEGKVISGDIHKPQRIGKRIEYVGSPYRVRFGDDFTPRVLLLKDKAQIDLYFPTVNKHLVVVRKLVDMDRHDEITPGDQVKVRVRLSCAEYPTWPEMRRSIVRRAQEREWVLYGPELISMAETPRGESDAAPEGVLSPENAVVDYAKSHKVSKPLLAVGMSILKEVPK